MPTPSYGASPARPAGRLAAFLALPEAPRVLGRFRVAVAAFALVQLWAIADYLVPLFGSMGMMQWVISENAKLPYLPSLAQLATRLAPYGLDADACVYGVALLYGLSLVALLVGWHTRPAAVLAWLAHMTLTNSGYFAVYGVETITHIALFYCVWMPVGRAYSLDQWRTQRPAAASPGAALALRTLQLHLCLIYLNTGLAKAAGAEWWSGEAVWRAVMQPQFSQMNLTWLAAVPWVPRLAGWGTLLVEIGYPVFIWPAATRRLWLGLTVLLHLGIGVFLGLWLFAGLMIILSVSAFGYTFFQSPARPTAPTR